MVRILLLKTNIPLTQNLSMDLVMQKFWLQVAQLEVQLHPRILQDILHNNSLHATVNPSGPSDIPSRGGAC